MSSESSTRGRPIAAFDFDGTVTRRDTLYPFLRRLVGRRRLIVAALVDLPRLGAAAFGRGDRDEAKARMFERLLAGFPVRHIHQIGAEHARRVLATQIRPEMRERIAWHRDRGHEVAIVSASLDVYLDEIGRELGVDHVICTTLEVRDGLLTGAMVDGNCRGANKVRRLRAAFSDLDDRELWAYGDSAGDDAMLAIADHPTRM
jgi:phosphatidylglycerophosphatase C